MTASARAVQAVRVGYGMVLVLTPSLALRLVTGRIPSRRTCRVARLLGARHLIQAAATAVAPRPEVLAIGGGVDAVHTASMLLAALRPARPARPAERRAVLADALMEAVLAAAGYSAGAVRTPVGQPRR